MAERGEKKVVSTAPRAAAARRANPLDAPKRRRPKQERSKTTVEQILNAAITILERGGFEALTMLTIAEEAGISIAAVYSYFPNKHHVLAHLARAHLEQRLALLDAEFQRLRSHPDWISGYCDVLAELSRLRAGQAGSVALRQAMHASPSLWEIDQEGNRRAAELVAALLRDMAGDDGNREVQGRLIAEYVTAGLDYRQDGGTADPDAVLRELTKLTRAYLQAITLDPSGRGKPAAK